MANTSYFLSGTAAFTFLSIFMSAYNSFFETNGIEICRNPMEVKYLFEKPIERARELGVPVPHLETLVAQISALQRFYNLF